MTVITMPQFPDFSEDVPVSEQAASWFVRMQDLDCTKEDEKRFVAWLSLSEVNQREYQKFQQLWSTLDHVTAPARASRPSNRSRRNILATLGAACVLGALFYLQRVPEELLTTQLGERKHVTLADGTVVDMNTATSLRVRMAGDSRTIVLERGEALFTVVHDASRPFKVQARNGVVRDIGTVFNVADDGRSVRVSVLEGAVEVTLDQRRERAAVIEGRQIAYSEQGLMATTLFDVAQAAAWREGRWMFRDTPLNDVIREINRYHARQTALADPELAQLKVSGVFNISDREGLLHALATLYPLKIEEREGVSHLARR